MVDDGIYSVDYVVDEGLEVKLACVEWAVRDLKGYQWRILEVLGEQRVSLSIWVCHTADGWEMLFSAIGRRDVYCRGRKLEAVRSRVECTYIVIEKLS